MKRGEEWKKKTTSAPPPRDRPTLPAVFRTAVNEYRENACPGRSGAFIRNRRQP